MENSVSLEKESAVCEACGAPVSPSAATCPTCRVSLAKPEPARVAREIALYVAAFLVVTLLLITVILLRRIYFFAVLMQGVLPFVILLVLAFVVVRFWKR